MPRWSLLLFVSALCAAPTLAQKKSAAVPTPVPTPILSRLDLDADGLSRIRAAESALHEELRRQKQAGTTDKQRLAPAFEAYRATLDQVLDAGRRERLLQLYEESTRYRGLGDLSYHLVALDLSEEQKGRILALIEQRRPELERLGAKAKLDRDQEAARQAADLRSELVNGVRAVLTPAQAAKLPQPKQGKG